MALICDENRIARRFYDKHLHDSNNQSVEMLVRQGIHICQGRHQGQDVHRNTVLFVNQTEHDLFIHSKLIWHPQTFSYISNIFVRFAVTLSAQGDISVRTQTRFLYGLDNADRVYHLQGLFGGRSWDVQVIRLRVLKKPARFFSVAKFPNTRGWGERDESEEEDPGEALVQLSNYPDSLREGEWYRRVTLWRTKRASKVALIGREYWVKKAFYDSAPTRAFFRYKGALYESA